MEFILGQKFRIIRNGLSIKKYLKDSNVVQQKISPLPQPKKSKKKLNKNEYL
jgi:hypothetical protein